GNAAFGRGFEEAGGVLIILLHTLAERVEHAEAILRDGVAALGALLEPRRELLRIGRRDVVLGRARRDRRARGLGRGGLCFGGSGRGRRRFGDGRRRGFAFCGRGGLGRRDGR